MSETKQPDVDQRCQSARAVLTMGPKGACSCDGALLAAFALCVRSKRSCFVVISVRLGLRHKVGFTQWLFSYTTTYITAEFVSGFSFPHNSMRVGSVKKNTIDYFVLLFGVLYREIFGSLVSYCAPAV